MYDPETLAIGVLGRPHGVHGEIALRPFNTIGRLRVLSPAVVGTVLLVHEGRTTSQRLLACRAAGDHLLLSFAGVDSPEAARALTHSEVRVSRQALPPLSPGEYYVEDVIGCDVVNDAGASLGRATSTFWNGAHDVMTVTGDDAGGEMLIPMVPELILAVDVAARRVRVNWQPPAAEDDPQAPDAAEERDE